MNGLFLFGGGLDSVAQTILMAKDGFNLTLMHVDYGQDAAVSESKVVREIARRYTNNKPIHVESRCTAFNKHPLFNRYGEYSREQYVLDGRNMFLASYAGMVAAHKGIESVILGFHKEPDNVYKDAQLDFLDKINDVYSYLEMKPVFIAPFADSDRLDVIREAYKIDSDAIKMAHSCYKREECGVCPHCMQKESIIQKCAE